MLVNFAAAIDGSPSHSNIFLLLDVNGDAELAASAYNVVCRRRLDAFVMEPTWKPPAVLLVSNETPKELLSADDVDEENEIDDDAD